MPRSSVGSAPADIDNALLASYPVDDIKDSTNCELHMKVKNLSMKVADGYALANPLKQPSIAIPFQLAMLVSGLMK